jgi:hypothetical protein
MLYAVSLVCVVNNRGVNLIAKSERSIVRLLQQCRFQSVVAADEDGQNLRVGAGHDTGCIGFVVDRYIVVRESIAAVVQLIGVDNCAVPVLGLAAGVVLVGLDVWLNVAVLDEECAAIISCAQARYDGFVHVVVVFEDSEWASVASEDVFGGRCRVGSVVAFAVKFHRSAARGVESGGRVADSTARAVERGTRVVAGVGRAVEGRACVVASIGRAVKRRAHVVASVTCDIAGTAREVDSAACVVETTRVVSVATREIHGVTRAVETTRVVTSATRAIDSAAQSVGSGLPSACHIAGCRLSVDRKGIAGVSDSGFVGVGIPVLRESCLIDGDMTGRRENTQELTFVVVDAELVPRLAVLLGLIDQVIADLVLAARW